MCSAPWLCCASHAVQFAFGSAFVACLVAWIECAAMENFCSKPNDRISNFEPTTWIKLESHARSLASGPQHAGRRTSAETVNMACSAVLSCFELTELENGNSIIEPQGEILVAPSQGNSEILRHFLAVFGCALSGKLQSWSVHELYNKMEHNRPSSCAVP